jgi:hypothetical protein
MSNKPRMLTKVEQRASRRPKENGGNLPKHSGQEDPDKDFVYTSADKTDVRQTFNRIRKEQEEERQKQKEEAAARLRNVISNRRFK